MNWLETAKRSRSPGILLLWDHLVKTYESANQGVVIVINRNGKKFGLLVDEIIPFQIITLSCRNRGGAAKIHIKNQFMERGDASWYF